MIWRRRHRDDLPTKGELIEFVRALNRIDPASLKPASPERIAQIVQAMIAATNEEPTRTRRRHWRRRVIGGGLAILVAGGGAAAWAVSRYQPARTPLSVTCHQDATLSGPVVAVEADRTSPVELCAGLWTDGDFGNDSAAPPLVACVGPEGVAAVFPGASPTVCDDLTLTPLAPEAPDAHRLEIQLQEALSDRTVSLGCIDATALTDIAAFELDRAGLDDWVVITQGESTSEVPCAVSRIEPVDREVVIEFVPDLWTATDTTTEEQ